MEEKINQIAAFLKNKTILHEEISKNSLEVLARLMTLSKILAEKINLKTVAKDKKEEVRFREINDHEFHLDFSGDLLIFTLHSHIMTFQEEHPVAMNSYVLQKPERSFFGHIMVYNFLSDSLSNNRTDDFGYLVARLLVNRENHFYVEGLRELGTKHPELANNTLNDDFLNSFIAEAMHAAITNDIVAPLFQEIQIIALGQKLMNQNVNPGQKVGFQSNTDRKDQT